MAAAWGLTALLQLRLQALNHLLLLLEFPAEPCRGGTSPGLAGQDDPHPTALPRSSMTPHMLHPTHAERLPQDTPKPGAPHPQSTGSPRTSTWSRDPKGTPEPHSKNSDSPAGAHTEQVPQALPGNRYLSARSSWLVLSSPSCRSPGKPSQRGANQCLRAPGCLFSNRGIAEQDSTAQLKEHSPHDTRCPNGPSPSKHPFLAHCAPRCPVAVPLPKVLTGAQLVTEPLGQLPALGQLLPESLAHVVVDVGTAEEVLKGPQSITQVLGQAAAHAAALPQRLPQVGELPSLRLDQRVVLPRRDQQVGGPQGCRTPQKAQQGQSTMSLGTVHCWGSAPPCKRPRSPATVKACRKKPPPLGNPWRPL